MICPLCKDRARVIESRPIDGGAGVRRRRECTGCSHRYTTFERSARAPGSVRKRDGRLEPFDPPKLRAGLERSAHKRPIDAAALDRIVARACELARGRDELTTMEIGELCLDGLREVDRVAYLRFASVHKQLADLDALSAELDELAISEEFEAEDPRGEGTDSPHFESHPARREIHA